MGDATIDSELLSIAVQTNDTGCSNGCTSVYIESGSLSQECNLEREMPGSEESSVCGDTNVFMESELVGPRWKKFNCKSGELLFYYNKDTAEHKFPMWNSTSRVSDSDVLMIL